MESLQRDFPLSADQRSVYQQWLKWQDPESFKGSREPITGRRGDH